LTPETVSAPTVEIGDPLQEGWLQATCKNYHLNRFLTAKIKGDDVEGRKRAYFEYIERIHPVVAAFKQSRRSSGSVDDAVRDYVAKMLAADGSFTEFVLQNRGPSTELDDEDKWTPIWLAAAGAVMAGYREAVEKGEWQP
jgi:hypothetical protein